MYILNIFTFCYHTNPHKACLKYYPLMKRLVWSCYLSIFIQNWENSNFLMTLFLDVISSKRVCISPHVVIWPTLSYSFLNKMLANVKTISAFCRCSLFPDKLILLTYIMKLFLFVMITDTNRVKRILEIWSLKFIKSYISLMSKIQLEVFWPMSICNYWCGMISNEMRLYFLWPRQDYSIMSPLPLNHTYKKYQD